MILSLIVLSLGARTPSVSSSPAVPLADGKISNATIEAAVKRAKATTGVQEEFTFQTGDGTRVVILQDPSTGGTALAGTATSPPPPQTGTYTVFITIYPEHIYQQFPGSKNDTRYLENMLHLILSHEMEHMPEHPGGGVPAHPTDPNGSPSLANKCSSIRQYVRDGERACAAATAALGDPDLSSADRCKLVHQYCDYHKMIQGLVNTPGYLGSAQSCNPPIPASSVHIVHDCPACGYADCPNSEHQY